MLCAARISRGRRAVLALAPSFAAPSASTSAAYARREPMSSVLHRIVREHLATFLATVLEDGVVKPVGSRIQWCQLLRRIYLLDVLACPCGGRRAIVADIPASEVVVAILAHLGLPPFAPPRARARSPSFDVA